MQKLQSISPRTLFVYTGIAFCLLGCRSTPPAVPPPDDGGLDARDPQATAEAVRLADARAMVLFSHGITLEVEGDWEGAASNYLQAVELDPENASLSMLTARRLFGQDRREEAFGLMDALLERQPQNAEALLWLASLQLGADQGEEALASYRQAAAVNPSAEEAYLAAARILQGLKREDEALEVLAEAVEKADQPLRAIQLRSSLLLQKANNTLDDAGARAIREEAIDLLRESAQRFPGDPNLPFHAANLLAREQRVVEMLDLYRQVADQQPGDLRQRQKVVVHLIRSIGDAGTAEMKLRAYLLREPDDALVHHFLGLLLEIDNRHAEALPAFERALTLSPDDRPSIWKRCQILISNDRIPEARDILNQHLEKAPDDLESLYLRASLLENEGKTDEALAVYATIQEHVDEGAQLLNTGHFHYSYAVAEFKAAHPDKAARQLEQALAANPQYLDLFWRNGLVLSDAAKEEDPGGEEPFNTRMLQTLKALAAALPDEPVTLQAIGRHHQFHRDYEAALKAYKRAMAIAERLPDPKTFLNADFYFDLGSTYERVKDLDEAERYLQRALNLKPDFANAYNTMAYMWAENNINLERALEYVTMALQHEPSSGAIVDTRGWVYFMLGRYEEAYQDLLHAAELLNDDPTITEHLGDVLVKLDKPIQALGYYHIAEELGPEKPLDGKIRDTQALIEALLSPVEEQEANPAPVEESVAAEETELQETERDATGEEATGPDATGPEDTEPVESFSP